MSNMTSQPVVVDLFQRCSRNRANTSEGHPTSSAVSGFTTLFPVDNTHNNHKTRCLLTTLLKELRGAFDIELDECFADAAVWGQPFPGDDAVRLPATATAQTGTILAISADQFEKVLIKNWKRSYSALTGAQGSARTSLQEAQSDSNEPSAFNPNVYKAQREYERIEQLTAALTQLQEILRLGGDADSYRGTALMSVVMGPEELRQENGPDLAGVAPPSPGAISAQDDNSLLTPPPGSIGHQTKIRHRGTSWGHILDTVTNRLNGLIVAHASAHWYGAGPQATHGSYPTEAEGSGGGSLPMLGAGQDADGSLPTPLQHSAKRRERSNAPSRSQAPSESDVRRSRAEPRSAGDEVYLTDEGARLNEAMDALHNQSGDGCEEVRRRRTERAQAFTDSNSRCIQDMNQVGCVNCHGDIHDEPQLGDFNGLIPPPLRDTVCRRATIPWPLASHTSIRAAGSSELERAVLSLPMQAHVVGCFRLGTRLGAGDEALLCPLDPSTDPTQRAEATVTSLQQLMATSSRKRSTSTDHGGLIVMDVPNVCGTYFLASNNDGCGGSADMQNTVELIFHKLTTRTVPRVKLPTSTVLHRATVLVGEHAHQSPVIRVGCVFDSVDAALLVVERVKSLERQLNARLYEAADAVKKVLIRREEFRKRVARRKQLAASRHSTQGTQLDMSEQQTPRRQELSSNVVIPAVIADVDAPSPTPVTDSLLCGRGPRLSRRNANSSPDGTEPSHVALDMLARSRRGVAKNVHGALSPSSALSALANQASLQRGASDEAVAVSQPSPNSAGRSRLAFLLENCTQIVGRKRERSEEDETTSSQATADSVSTSEATSESSEGDPTQQDGNSAIATRHRRHSAQVLNLCGLWCSMLKDPPTSVHALLELLHSLRERPGHTFPTMFGVQFNAATFEAVRRIELSDVHDLLDPACVPTSDAPFGTCLPAMHDTLKWVVEAVGRFRCVLFDFGERQHVMARSHSTPTTPHKRFASQRPQPPDVGTAMGAPSSVSPSRAAPAAIEATLDRSVKMRIGLHGCTTFADLIRKLQDETGLSVRSISQRYVGAKSITSIYNEKLKQLLRGALSMDESAKCDIFQRISLESLLVSPFLLTVSPLYAAIAPPEPIWALAEECTHLHVESHAGCQILPDRDRARPHVPPRKSKGSITDQSPRSPNEDLQQELVEDSVRESSSSHSGGAYDDDAETPHRHSYIQGNMELEVTTPVFLRTNTE